MTELVEEIFNCPPIYNSIFACLSPPDIYRVRLSSRMLRDAVDHFHNLAYNINRHLSHFFKDPKAFRQLQAKEHFLISGSNALQFMDRSFYPKSDMDIFAYPESVKELGLYLVKSEGYQFEPREKQAKKFEDVDIKQRDLTASALRRWGSQHAWLYTSGMNELFRFKRPSDDVEVQIISTSKSPLDCILHFHSSCVMNFISHIGAYALYPVATFDKRISLAFGSTNYEKTQEAYRKYTDRGWSFPAKLDFHSVKVPLDTSDVDLDVNSPFNSLSPKNPFHYNGWVLDRVFDSWDTEMELAISFHIFHSPYFRGTYSVPNDTVQDVLDQFLDYVLHVNPAECRLNKHLDHLLPNLHCADKKVPKRLYDQLV
ncbi:hypothetical protein CC2G_000842 [Coprinopsis cinerea AmutBmut pab1-1]|nr:hypothetical protein CC2G_000842 [Coprinopsis cinerea AmutBmut pab1-1]